RQPGQDRLPGALRRRRGRLIARAAPLQAHDRHRARRVPGCAQSRIGAERFGKVPTTIRQGMDAVMVAIVALLFLLALLIKFLNRSSSYDDDWFNGRAIA